MTSTVKFSKLLLTACVLCAQVACYNQALDRTYGRRFHDIFQVQASERQTLAPSAMKGEEERRIVAAYYGTLAPENTGNSSSVQNFNPGSGLSPAGGTQSSGTMDLRSR